MPSAVASTPTGLLERIRIAQNEAEVSRLLLEGSGYQNASNGTRNRWRKAAAKRRKELEEQ